MQEDGSDMTLHFKGIGGEDGTLSMDYLEDVLRFGKALKAISKVLYVHKSGKKRAPANFKGIEFSLSGLNTGSTIVKFKPVDFGPSDITMANDTFDIVTRHLSGAGIDTSEYKWLNGYDPAEIIESKCKGLWNNLDEKVSLEFSNGSTKYRFDRVSRGMITDTRIEEPETSLIGAVYEMDCNSRKFKMQYVDSSGKERTVTILFGKTDEDQIMEAMKNRANSKVRITGRGTINGRILKDVELFRFELLDPMDTTGRFEEIIRLASKNFKDENELRNYANRIRSFEKILDKEYTCREKPYIYPTPDNNLEFEWSSNNYVLTVELGTMMAELIGEDDESDVQLNLNETKSWKKLCGLIMDETESQ